MKRSKKIHDINSLDREIARLQSEAAHVENKLGDNLEHLKRNATGFIINAMLCGKKTGRDQTAYEERHFFKNERLNSFFNKVADSFSQRLGDFVTDIFRKKKHDDA